VPAPPGSWWYNEEADKVVVYSLDKAREYLKKSKYPDGAEFEITIPATPYLLDTKDAAVVIQAQLQKLNIKVNLKMAEPNVVVGQYVRGEQQSTLVNIMSPGEPTYLIVVNFTAGQVMSKTSNYTNPKIDELLKGAFAETDQAKLKPLYAEMMRIFAEEQPYVWLGFFDVANLWRDNVKNFRVNQGLSFHVRDVIPG
jgi:peptide/nickel transport system substrate-binding protein